MQNRTTHEMFKRDLYELLIEDQISLDTSIVSEIIHEMAGVEYKSSGSDFNFSSSDKEKINFSISSLKWPQVQKFLKLFNIPEDEYVSNSSLSINVEYVYKELFPKFQAYYQNLKDTGSDIIKKYKIESKSILENVAIETLSKYARAAIEVILPKKSSEIPEGLNSVVNGLHSLLSEIGYLKNKPTLYKNIIDFTSKVLKYLQLPQVIENTALKQKLGLILEGIELFKTHHRTEAVLKNIAFAKEMKHFLKDYKIATSECDIIEESLLSMADVRLGLKGKCKFESGYDPSRLVFNFKDIDKENTRKLVQYLRDQGDDTALEGYGYSRGGRAIPESYNEKACFSLSAQSAKSFTKVVVEEHSVETDGKFFYDTMMKKLQNDLSFKLNNNVALLKKYQDLSANYFEEKQKNDILKGKMTLFPGNNGTTQSQSSMGMDIDISSTITFGK